MSPRRLLLTVMALTLLTSPVQAQPASQPDKVKVPHAFPPGVYTLTITGQSEMTVTVADKPLPPTKSTDTEVWELNVGQPNDKGLKPTTLKLVRLQSVERGEKEVAFDSDKPLEGQPAGLVFVYKPLLGLPVQVSLDSDDTVIEVSGLTALWNQLAGKAASDEEKESLTEVQVGLSDKAMEYHLRRWESLTPKNPVAAGDKWQAGLRTDIPMIGEIKVRFDCKLQSIEPSPAGPVAAIAADGTFESTSPRTAKIQGTDVTIDKIAALEKTTLKVDVKTGLALSDESTVNMTADMKFKGEDGKDVPANIKMAGTNKAVVEPKKPGGPAVIPGVEEKPAGSTIIPGVEPPARSRETGSSSTGSTGVLVIPGVESSAGPVAPANLLAASADPTYGYKQDNPVRAGSESAARAYVRRLRDSKGVAPKIDKIVTLQGGIDLYELDTSDGPVNIYVDYREATVDPSSLKAPKGMTLAAE